MRWLEPGVSGTFFVGGPEWHSLRRSLEVLGFFAWSTTPSETTFIPGCSAARAITQAAPADAGLGLAPNWICCLFPAHFVEFIGHGSWIWLKCASCLQSGLWRAVAVPLGVFRSMLGRSKDRLVRHPKMPLPHIAAATEHLRCKPGNPATTVR